MILFDYLVYPGILFTLLVAFAVSWIDRKVSALVQWRIGPPPLQPFYDFFKLMKKETLVPGNTPAFIFLLAPALGFASVMLVSLILFKSNLYQVGFVGDIFAVVYLLMVPVFSLLMAGALSSNPLASLGASREMKMALSYELPFILCLSVVIIKTGGMTGLGDIIFAQNSSGPVIYSLSGIIAFVVVLLCFQAKMMQIPFDISEAEQEIMGGTLIEYSGPPLGFFILTRWALMAVLPFFAVILFTGGVSSPLGLLKYIGVIVISILIKNTNPRMRIDQALKFFWGPVTGAAALSVILALAGL
ncbi:MAG: complex I subunit 1 family protein [Elusimicrobiota bacterium]